jgi:hypothetical protein
MSHTLTIAEEGKHATLSRMHSYGGLNAYTDNFTSPRMTNRQLKYFFARLQRTIQATVLNKLQQIFKSSKGCDKWLAAFVAVLGMCMALEDQQKTIHLVMQTRSASEGTDPRDAQSQADSACCEIDTRMLFVQQIFRWKYNRKHNPLLNPDHDWEKEVGFGDASSVCFVRQVAQLVRENSKSITSEGDGHRLIIVQRIIYASSSASASRTRTRRGTRRGWSASSCCRFGCRTRRRRSMFYTFFLVPCFLFCDDAP